MLIMIINNQKRTCWGWGKCEETGMANCTSYENYLKEKMERCLLTVHHTAGISPVLEPRGPASLGQGDSCKTWCWGSGWNDSRRWEASQRSLGQIPTPEHCLWSWKALGLDPCSNSSKGPLPAHFLSNKTGLIEASVRAFMSVRWDHAQKALRMIPGHST